MRSPLLPTVTICAALTFAASLAAQPKPAEPPKKPEPKRVKLEFRDKRWVEVLDWLSEQADLRIVGPSKPAGTLTFIAPAGKTYTIPEVIDILNEALRNQGRRLVP